MVGELEGMQVVYEHVLQVYEHVLDRSQRHQEPSKHVLEVYEHLLQVYEHVLHDQKALLLCFLSHFACCVFLKAPDVFDSRLLGTVLLAHVPRLYLLLLD